MILKSQNSKEKLIVALDVPSVQEAQAIVNDLGDIVEFYKVGHQLAFAGGLTFTEELIRQGKKIFLDMKLLDIDNTIKHGIENIAQMGVTLTTIHAYPKAMQAAVSSRKDSKMGLLAVTVLTNMNSDDLAQAGYKETDPELLVYQRAHQAVEANMDGIVCSPLEAENVREIIGEEGVIVTPGVRPKGADLGDQIRVMTPAEAIRAGADYLVVGRPITKAKIPAFAAQAIIDEIEAAS